MSSFPTITYFIPSLLDSLEILRNCGTEHCSISSLTQDLELQRTIEITSQSSQMVSIDARQLTQIIQPTTCYIIIFHNHPSQNVFPSHADYQTTHKLVNLGELLHFTVLDHVIVTSEEYFSFAESGILKDIKIPSS